MFASLLALHELYIEAKGLDVETRQMGHRAECDLCGDMVDFERAIPNGQGGAVSPPLLGGRLRRSRLVHRPPLNAPRL